jgi:hypothetical protein
MKIGIKLVQGWWVYSGMGNFDWPITQKKLKLGKLPKIVQIHRWKSNGVRMMDLCGISETFME